MTCPRSFSARLHTMLSLIPTASKRPGLGVVQAGVDHRRVLAVAAHELVLEVLVTVGDRGASRGGIFTNRTSRTGDTACSSKLACAANLARPPSRRGFARAAVETIYLRVASDGRGFARRTVRAGRIAWRGMFARCASLARSPGRRALTRAAVDTTCCRAAFCGRGFPRCTSRAPRRSLAPLLGIGTGRL